MLTSAHFAVIRNRTPSQNLPTSELTLSLARGHPAVRLFPSRSIFVPPANSQHSPRDERELSQYGSVHCKMKLFLSRTSLGWLSSSSTDDAIPSPTLVVCLGLCRELQDEKQTPAAVK